MKKWKSGTSFSQCLISYESVRYRDDKDVEMAKRAENQFLCRGKDSIHATVSFPVRSDKVKASAELELGQAGDICAAGFYTNNDLCAQFSFKVGFKAMQLSNGSITGKRHGQESMTRTDGRS